jgi:hypothetical protein
MCLETNLGYVWQGGLVLEILCFLFFVVVFTMVFEVLLKICCFYKVTPKENIKNNKHNKQINPSSKAAIKLRLYMVGNNINKQLPTSHPTTVPLTG